MRGTRRWASFKLVLAILCAVCFLTTSIGSVSRAVAADAFETWPKKPVEPAGAPIPPESGGGAAIAGEAAGQQAATGISYGTIGWIALGTAVVIGIAIAAGSGGSGGGSTTPPTH